MAIEGKNYYELLGVEVKATPEEIKASYRELARIFHPDSHYFDDLLDSAAAPVSSDQTFKAITNAYNELMDPEKRAAYDRSLPRTLAGWEEDRIPSGYDDGRFDGKPRPSAAHARAFGVFGKFQDIGGESEVDSAEEPNLEPVVVPKRGLLARLRNLLRL
jgi:DnaJ-class molecular chaperone